MIRVGQLRRRTRRSEALPRALRRLAEREGEDLGDVRLVLQPVARFRATLTCDQLGRRGVPATAFLRSFDGRTLGRARAEKGVVDVRLPPGHYSLYVYGSGKQEIDARLFPFAVSSGEDARARPSPGFVAAESLAAEADVDVDPGREGGRERRQGRADAYGGQGCA